MKPCLLQIPIILFVALSCTKQVTKQPETLSITPMQQEEAPPSYAKKTKKDTVSYCIEFADSLERRRFTDSLEKLIKAFPSKTTYDSNAVRFVKAQSVVVPQVFHDITKSQPAANAAPNMKDSVREKPAVVPRSAGSITLYTPRSGLDQTLRHLVEAFPFNNQSCHAEDRDTAARYCAIKSVSDKKIILTVSPNARDATGKPFSSFGMVTLWNNYVKQHPAEGRALFRFVAGLDQFIGGREAVISGFQVTDDKTISLQLSQPDGNALQRLCTPRLFPASFNAGPYYIKADNADALQLTPNVNYLGAKPSLASCRIITGKDGNPFLSFSMKRYDAMTFFSIKDLDYARRFAADKSEITVFSEDRYFIAVALQSPQIRQFLKKIIDPKDILINSVKAEGNLLASMESSAGADSGVKQPSPVSVQQTLASAPPAAAPITILIGNEDPIARIIGDKLLSDISRAGLACSLKSVPIQEYEKSLVKRDFGCAVGCAPKNITGDVSERLRLSSMWFNDEMNESARIENLQEIPLFSVKTYLLYSKKMGLLNGVITEMFVN